MENNILDSFLLYLKKQIAKYKEDELGKTKSDDEICIPDLPMAQETMAYYAFYSDIIKVLGDTFNEMSKGASSTSYSTEIEEEKAFLDIAGSYQEGVLNDIGEHIKVTPTDNIKPAKTKFNEICEFYTKVVCHLKKSISDAKALLNEIDRYLVPKTKYTPNDEVNNARTKLEATIKQGEGLIISFYRSFQSNNQIKAPMDSESFNSMANTIDSQKTDLIFEIKYLARSFFKDLLDSTLFSLWKDDAAVYTPVFTRIPSNVRSITCTAITNHQYQIEYVNGSSKKVMISDMERLGYVKRK